MSERDRGRFMVITLVVSAMVMAGLTLGAVIGGLVTSAINTGSGAYAALVPIMFAFVVVGGVGGIRAGLWAAQRLVGVRASRPSTGMSMLLSAAGLIAAAGIAAVAPGFVMPVLVLLPGIGAAAGDAYAARRGRSAAQVVDSLKKRG